MMYLFSHFLNEWNGRIVETCKAIIECMSSWEGRIGGSLLGC